MKRESFTSPPKLSAAAAGGKGDHNVYHIKVDWETHQIFMKCRDKLGRPMAGPTPRGRLLVQSRRITKDAEHSNPVIRSFIASFDVALINDSRLKPTSRLSSNL